MHVAKALYVMWQRCRATCDWLGSALGNCDLDVGVYHAGKDAVRRRKVRQGTCSLYCLCQLGFQLSCSSHMLVL